MLKNKNIYFTGKVLNVKELASDNAKSFRFSKEERKQLNLKGLPIRLEHEDNLEVGTITNSWNGNDNQHWVFGRIDKNTIPATFAKHPLMKSGPNKQNKPYYTGLSLQHVHREYPDGRTEKKGIEVSLCTDPRRPNCNIIWTSNNNNKMVPKLETRNMPYKLVKQLASKNNIMSQVVPTENTQETEKMETETEVPQTQEVAPTGAELSEQVYAQFSELMEKEKAQQDKIKQLEAQLAQHNETLEKEKKKKQEEDAAKGRALMSTFLEHVKELVGDQQDLQATVEPLIAQNPEGMGRVMEIVSKASKKFAENSLALKQAQTSLKDKELELKFQKLIQNNAINATNTQNNSANVTEIIQAASKKREAPQTNVQKAVKNVVNPYSLQRDTRKQAAPRMQQRRRGGMNADLLKMYNQSKGDGLRAMGKLHKSLTQRQQRSTMF